MMMKTLITAALMSLTLTGCWDETKPQSKTSAEFMSNLAKCGDCRLSKPLLGPGSAADGN